VNDGLPEAMAFFEKVGLFDLQLKYGQVIGL
jgi:hypothetical protein